MERATSTFNDAVTVSLSPLSSKMLDRNPGRGGFQWFDLTLDIVLTGNLGKRGTDGIDPFGFDERKNGWAGAAQGSANGSRLTRRIGHRCEVWEEARPIRLMQSVTHSCRNGIAVPGREPPGESRCHPDIECGI